MKKDTILPMVAILIKIKWNIGVLIQNLWA